MGRGGAAWGAFWDMGREDWVGQPGEDHAEEAAAQSWAKACGHLKGTRRGREASKQAGSGGGASS